jgi:hypothetical protein
VALYWYTWRTLCLIQCSTLWRMLSNDMVIRTTTQSESVVVHKSKLLPS